MTCRPATWQDETVIDVTVSIDAEQKTIQTPATWCVEIPPEDSQFINVYETDPWDRYGVTIEPGLINPELLAGVSINGRYHTVRITSQQRPPVDVLGDIEVWRQCFDDLYILNRSPDSLLRERSLAVEFRRVEFGNGAAFLALERVAVIV